MTTRVWPLAALARGERLNIWVSAMHDLNSEPWFQEGLRFRCTMCGNCCTGAPGVVWVNDAEVHEIANFVGQTTEEFLEYNTRVFGDRRSLVEKSNNDCIFYDRQKGCTIYPVRPRQCRTWPFWQSNVESPASWKKTCDTCPGSGQGDLIPVEEIVRRVQVIKL
jgi:uncharacterized protein